MATRLLLVHDPDHGCFGTLGPGRRRHHCPLLHEEFAYCQARPDLGAKESLTPAPAWCPLRTGAVVVAGPPRMAYDDPDAVG